jgi:GNAT superfamily N-acetyltransferase
VAEQRNFTAPVVLGETHDLTSYASGEPSLDAWLRERARDNLRLGASRTYVACPQDSPRVVAYYALAMGGILNQDVTGSMRRNMPHTIPAIILGRLAVCLSAQGAGLGAGLLRDAVLRSLRAASEVSARLLIVHALSPAAEVFYLRHGFTRLPLEVPILALDLAKLGALKLQVTSTSP